MDTNNKGRGSGGGRGGGGRQPTGGGRNQGGNRNQSGGAKRDESNGNGPTQHPVAAKAPAQPQQPAPKPQAQPAAVAKPALSAKHLIPHKDLLFQKVAIFVDAENIEMSSLKHHEGRTDYKKILEYVGDREILRILYYKPIYKDISAEFETFWFSLGGEIKRPNKNADTFLVIDAVTMADKIDVAIILGGDKDFLPLMWYLRSRGCKVEIWSWPETTSPEMKEAADYYHPLTEEFVIGKNRR